MSNYGMSPFLLQRLQQIGDSQRLKRATLSDDETARGLMAQRLTAPPDGIVRARVSAAPQEIPLDLDAPGMRLNASPDGAQRVTSPQGMGMMLRSPTAPQFNGSPSDGRANFQRITAPPSGGFLENYQRASAAGSPSSRLSAPPQEIPLDGMRLLPQAGEIPFEPIQLSPEIERQMNQRAVINARPVTSQRAGYADASAAQRAAYDMGPAQRRALTMLETGPSQHHGSGG